MLMAFFLFRVKQTNKQTNQPSLKQNVRSHEGGVGDGIEGRPKAALDVTA